MIKKLNTKITASEVARIWRERSKEKGEETPYTRFSVYAHRDKLGYVETPLGLLYDRDTASKIDLPPYNARPDVAERNRKLYTGRQRNKENHEFLPVSEIDTKTP